MMVERPEVFDPISLEAHLEDDHGIEQNLAHYMDSRSLRDLHDHLHNENIAFLAHFHTE